MIEYVSCHDGQNYIGIYEFPLDEGKSGCCYRSRTSFNAFFYNSKKNRFIDKEQKLFYHTYSEREYTFHSKGEYQIFKNIPVQQCTGVYDFFEKIGYDYKKGRYIHD